MRNLELIERQADWSKVEFFKPEDFADPEYPGSWIYMAPETIYRLDKLRKETGWPIVPHNRFGIRGCVCVDSHGHSEKSYHYADHPEGCSAVDWHFACKDDPRDQAFAVLTSGFRGVGIYYDWHWGGVLLAVGFHTDCRLRPQVWRREKGEYFYLLK